jgi:hypothetical protein
MYCERKTVSHLIHGKSAGICTEQTITAHTEFKKNIVPVHVACIVRLLHTERWDFPQLNFKYNKP